VRVVCAPNAFKGSLDARAAAAAMARGVRAAGADPLPVPVADGGDGTLDVLLGAAGPRARVDVVRVTGPLGDPIEARLGWLEPGTAVVELAEASGLRLVPPGRRDALRATSRGTGELIAAALDAGAARVLVGVGGSACTDGGAGLAAALGIRLLDAAGRQIGPGGAGLAGLATVDAAARHPRLRACRVEVAVDVASPLLGPGGAAAVFGPQKGASPEEVEGLEAGLRRLAAVLQETGSVPADLHESPGAGAAGGCGYGLAALCGAVLLPGAGLVADRVGLDTALAGAALALTGEGRIDASTTAGKAPVEVARRAARAGVACVALVGGVEGPPPPRFARVVEIGAGRPPEERVARAAELIEAAAAAVVAAWAPAG
jgi:glycerate 2-kinase